jgi:hypothetical protein
MNENYFPILQFQPFNHSISLMMCWLWPGLGLLEFMSQKPKVGLGLAWLWPRPGLLGNMLIQPFQLVRATVSWT